MVYNVGHTIGLSLDQGRSHTDGSRNLHLLRQVNKNLIAVGYGEFEFANQRDGMIAFWSPKNPCYPHSVIPTQAGVTSLDFATSSPSLLAGAFLSSLLA